MENPSDMSQLDSDSIQGPMGQYGDATLEQILDVDLFRRFPMTPVESGGETGGIGKIFSLTLHPNKQRQNPSPYVTWTSI